MATELACPRCRARLDWSQAEAACTGCGGRFASAGDVPVLLDASLETPHMRAQAEEHDVAADERLEVERPRGTPLLYGRLLMERFERSVRGVPALRPGATVAVVCAGPGMDAELLAAMGCRVTALDVSVGATRRARVRARRNALDLRALVAAAEHLPLADRSVDVAYVHDGLHHLENPLAGLREMTRVARRAVIVSEPAVAAATRLAVRAGVASDVEPGGNRVARLTAAEIERELSAAGFAVVRAHRYAMHYRPEGGRVVRALSRRRLAGPAHAALAAANRVAGRLGNKLVVQAVRP
jgi:ubiquinone/menaquinone biosynthesis C-methylase UbiE/uncharacterized protein YbaR (Trm112 family)